MSAMVFNIKVSVPKGERFLSSQEMGNFVDYKFSAVKWDIFLLWDKKL